jgi:hypothetical protein
MPADQPAGPTLAHATTAGPSDVLTPDDGHAVAAPPQPIKIRRSTAGVLSGMIATTAARRENDTPGRSRCEANSATYGAQPHPA